MNLPIENRTVLVTGANRGIGKAIVEEALNRGATMVYAAVRNPGSASPLVEQFGERVVPIHLDLTDAASIAAAAETASDVEIVVNNAGVLKSSSAVDAGAIEALEYELDVNVYGLLRVAQAFAPVLKANGGGAFAQLNSVVSVKSFADVATYSASKAASYSLTQGLRESLREQGTRVVSVHPGPIQTDMAAAAGLLEIAEPPSLVAKELFDAIEEGRFHVWPDTMSKQFGEAYRNYAENIIEADLQASPTH